MPEYQTDHKPDPSAVSNGPRPDPFGFDPTHLVELRAEYASDNPILPDSPAGIVTRAAKLMHERADDAPRGSWFVLEVRDPQPHGYTHRVIGEFTTDTGGTAWEAVGDMLELAAAYVASLAPKAAHAIANAWEHQADDMTGALAHFHPVDRVDGTQTWAVADERESTHYDWTATVEAALEYLREDAPAVTP